MTGERTWEKPDMNAAGQPPSPPPEPKGPQPPAVPKKKEREADQWEQIKPAGGRKYWYNKKVRSALARPIHKRSADVASRFFALMRAVVGRPVS